MHWVKLGVTSAALAAFACGGRASNLDGADVGHTTGGAVAAASGGVTTASAGGGYSVAVGGRIGVGGNMTTTSTGGTSPPPACGNSYIDLGEECDDGNTLPGDGCSATCKLEGWSPCVGCVRTIVCGNALVEPGEVCDDGNITERDGCTSKCVVEPGYYCPVPGKACLPLGVPPNCGNGVIDPGETCDEGALDAGADSDAGDCPVDCGVTGACGNGLLEAWSGEQCDDGVNDGRYGGCMPTCQFAAYCGDGIANGNEQCDLGFANSPAPAYGGCSTTCTLGPYCGDGIVQSPEECDLGPLNRDVEFRCTVACRFSSYIGP